MKSRENPMNADSNLHYWKGIQKVCSEEFPSVAPDNNFANKGIIISKKSKLYKQDQGISKSLEREAKPRQVEDDEFIQRIKTLEVSDTSIQVLNVGFSLIFCRFLLTTRSTRTSKGI